jgi:AcrR family transcriptional regulator
MAAPHRSIDPILQGAKALIAEVGVRSANMIDIAARSAVARATVYNHFTDKDALLEALLKSEITRLTEVVADAPTQGEALFALSRELSTDRALAKIAISDPDYFLLLVRESESPIWNSVHSALSQSFGVRYRIVLTWLLGQLASPLTESESKSQAAAIASVLQ